jgi:hypothetical protein
VARVGAGDPTEDPGVEETGERMEAAPGGLKLRGRRNERAGAGRPARGHFACMAIGDLAEAAAHVGRSQAARRRWPRSRRSWATPRPNWSRSTSAMPGPCSPARGRSGRALRGGAERGSRSLAVLAWPAPARARPVAAPLPARDASRRSPPNPRLAGRQARSAPAGHERPAAREPWRRMLSARRPGRRRCAGSRRSRTLPAPGTGSRRPHR